MNGQLRHFIINTMPRARCLFDGGVKGNNNITQQSWHPRNGNLLLLGKGQHIGRFMFSPVARIQILNRGVIDQQYAHFDRAVANAFFLERNFNCLANGLLAYAYGML